MGSSIQAYRRHTGTIKSFKGKRWTNINKKYKERQIIKRKYYMIRHKGL